ncbi:MAG: polyphenol oxidase family protein [Phycisphaerae bacterium]
MNPSPDAYNDVPTTSLSETSLENTTLFRFPSFEAVDGFAHAITSRPWNMATHCGADVDQTVARRQRICQTLGLPFNKLTAVDQIHSPHVIRILPADVGAGREGRHTALRFIDGMICDLPGAALMQFSADCPILLLVDPNRRILGTAHASWRGTVARIATELVHQMRREFDVNPAELIAGIGPCAGPLEYEVGEAVRRVALARLPDADGFFPRVGETLRFDLRGANVDQLRRAGVDPSHISVASISTMIDERFYSHRRDGPETGRFALIAGWLERHSI